MRIQESLSSCISCDLPRAALCTSFDFSPQLPLEMLDPLTALGLAGNVIQFIDFGSKLLKKSRDIQRDGASTVLTDFTLLAADVERLSQILETLTIHQNEAERPAELELFRLKRECQEIAQELLVVPPQTRRFASLHNAFKVHKSEKQVAELARRLSRMRQQLELTILVQLK
jgi:hypothetical protein